MSNGSDEDGEDMVVGRTNRAQSGTELLVSQDQLGGGNDFILRVRNEVAISRVGGIRAEAGLFGVIGSATGGEFGGTGLIGTGATGVEGRGGTGVRGLGKVVGVFARGINGVIAEGTTVGLSAHGISSQTGIGLAEIGVHGIGKNGVVGEGRGANEAPPSATEADGKGVIGIGRTGVEGRGTLAGVTGVGNSVGVEGENLADFGIGVLGTGNGPQGIGVAGASNTGVGVLARGNQSSVTALFAEHTDAGGHAGFFKGRVLIHGLLVVVGPKSAAVPHPDGSHRLLYCMESPESWFEDFGEGQLVDGNAEVRLDPDFAALVDVDEYHVFITPYGESKGLFVPKRYATGFRVCEQQGGTSNVSFAYRVVAKRKDILADRLATVTLPDIPSQAAGGTDGSPTNVPSYSA